jgi:hypothetical protein
MIEGDRVKYIYNVNWMNRQGLIGSNGILKKINLSALRDDGYTFNPGEYYLYEWGYGDSWWVPKNHLRKLKPSDIS